MKIYFWDELMAVQVISTEASRSSYGTGDKGTSRTGALNS